MDDPAGLAAKLGLYLTLMPLFGLPAFALVERWCARGARLSVTALLALSGAALLLSLLQLAALAASMSGVRLRSVNTDTLSDLMAAHTLFLAWEVRIGAVIVVAVAALAAKRRPAAAVPILSAAAAVALGTLAWFGHGAMDDGAIGWLHLGADLVHLLAAGLWTGALVTLVAMLWRPGLARDDASMVTAERALAGFAGTGTWVVILLVLTGLVNGWLLIGPSNLAALPGDAYGRLLIVKLLLFGAMLALAALNRFRLTPRLAVAIAGREGRANALARLRASLIAETAALATILALVAWLGMLAPTGSG